MAAREDHETSALLRVSHLPLVRSMVQSVTSAYSGAKDRYPLLGLMGGVAEVGVRNISEEAMRRATPLLESLEPQIEAANSFALVGLDNLEKNFPFLNQSPEEMLKHLKDAFFLTLDDLQMWVVDGLDGALNQVERLAEGVRQTGRQLQETPVGQAAALGLDNILSRMEDATAYYLPLPPTMRREWEMRVQEYEDEDEDEEPGLWTRVRSLLLTLSLQLYHRLSKVREQLQRAVRTLEGAANKAESLRETTTRRIKDRATALAEMRPLQQIRELPDQIQQALKELQELSKILLQLVINTTPLYKLLDQPSHQEVQDFLNQEDVALDSSSRRSSANSLFLKAMDGRPRRRRSLYSRINQSPGESPNGRRSSLKDGSSLDVPPPSEGNALRRPSATDLLLAPLKQFVSQSQKAFEYLSPNSMDNTTASAEEVDS
ncbi:perilipin-2-like isoform X2 [Oryzias latipes]|uniref:perilipin-2-like isoform X2 n=1 Tax=Oryzias latipes TaxID=8090 RepID=UPI0005CBC4B2|nr:perilipin-2-like isoform X2 [Oryzias latipes]